jgi:citrate lyase subunit beta / citryl-CoA lyase
MRALRSLLSVPGNREDFLAKSLTLDADALIIDLEDSVPDAENRSARKMTRGFLDDHCDDVIAYVRVNPTESDLLEDDLDAIVCAGLAGIQLPKTSEPAHVVHAAALLSTLEAERGLPDGEIEMIISLESARGVYHAYDILAASPRVGSVMPATAGHGDLQRDLGCLHTEDEMELLHVRSHVLLAARALGIENPIDGVYSDVRDEEGFIRCASLARQIGYRGKKLIHPTQIPHANRIFAPTEAELDFYRRVLEALEEAATRGSSATVVDGIMVDTATIETSRRALEWAEGIAHR